LAVSGLDPDDTRPPYQQVAAAIRGQITGGQLVPGTKLPKHDELVNAYGVSLGTIKRALGQLQDEGLIVSRRGEGAFVRSDTSDRPATGDADMRQAVEDLSRRLAIVERKLDRLG
jgi:GntR family transcriptional regulator